MYFKRINPASHEAGADSETKTPLFFNFLKKEIGHSCDGKRVTLCPYRLKYIKSGLVVSNQQFILVV